MPSHSLIRSTVPGFVAGIIGGVASMWAASGAATGVASTVSGVRSNTTTSQATTTRPAAITANRFALIDDEGNTLASLAIDAGGQPRLVLSGRGGKVSIELGMFSILREDPNSPALDAVEPYPFVALYHNGSARVMLHFDGLELQGERGTTRISLGMNRSGLPALEVFGPDGWPLWTAP